MLVYPLVKLVAIAFGGAGGVANISAFFASSAHTRTIVLTFIDSAVVTFVCVTVGAVLAWSLHTASSRTVKAVLWAAIIVPFLMGSVIKLYALVVMLESHGVVNRALMGLGITDAPIRMLYNQFAVVLGLTYHMLPFAVLPLLAGFQSIDRGQRDLLALLERGDELVGQRHLGNATVREADDIVEFLRLAVIDLQADAGRHETAGRNGDLEYLAVHLAAQIDRSKKRCSPPSAPFRTIRGRASCFATSPRCLAMRGPFVAPSTSLCIPMRDRKSRRSPASRRAVSSWAAP